MSIAETAVQQRTEILCCSPVCRQPITEERAIYDTITGQMYHPDTSCFGEGYRWTWAIRGTMPQKTDYKIIQFEEARELKGAGKLKEMLQMPKD